MRVAVLTGGGDCPGLNAAIRAVVTKTIGQQGTVIGVKRGWAGFLERDYVNLDLDSVSGILSKGGAIIGTSRTNPFKHEHGLQLITENTPELDLTGLIAIGGEDTLGVAFRLWKEGLPMVGIPKTIDNDLQATDYAFGFDTAVNIATEAIDRLHTTAESHNRVIVIEVMGRHAGWIAVESGIASGAGTSA